MDIKKAGVFAGGFVGSFLIFVAIIYFLYPYMDEKGAREVKEQFEIEANNTESIDDTEQTIDSPAATTSVNERIETLSDADRRSIHYEAAIDSLHRELSQIKDEYEQRLRDQESSFKNEELESTAKTLLNLEQETLTPIANQLEHEQLMKLYRAANNMQKQKLLGALKPDKASKIIKQALQ